MDQLWTLLPLVLMVSSRVAGVTAASPIFANRFIATPLRVAFTFLLAILLLPVARIGATTPEGIALLGACVLELVVGLVIGFLGQLLFAVLQMAGSMLDMDMGLSMAQVIDPASNHSQPVLGALFQTLALVVYFSLNAHHWLIRGLAESYTAIPAGGLATSSAAFLPLVYSFGALIAAAVKMVLPFSIAMMVTTAVLAGMNKAVQQMQVFQVGMGIKTVAGLALIAVMLPYLLGFLEPLFASGHEQLLQTLHGLH